MSDGQVRAFPTTGQGGPIPESSGMCKCGLCTAYRELFDGLSEGEYGILASVVCRADGGVSIADIRVIRYKM